MKLHCKYDELVSYLKLKPHPKNRNKHPAEQIDRLAKILEYQGCRSPIVVSKRSGYIVKGHGTLLALQQVMKKEGDCVVPIVYQDFDDDEQEYAFVQSDNAIASWAELDLSGINSDLSNFGPFDIDLLGIKDFTVDVSEKYEGDPDEIPETPVGRAHVQPGDLFALGQHRLLCGDSTKRECVERLMSGEKADMVFTDPPYNVSFQYNEYNDTKVSYAEWESTCAMWLAQWKNMASRIVLTPGCYNLELWCRISQPTHIGAWIKENANTTGRITHLWKWEPIIFIGKFERKRASDVFTHHVMSGFLREEDTGCHPCPKPMTLWSDLVEHFSDSGDLIFEPFCGSGTSIIAAEKKGRRCYATEIDPLYADLILDRWAKFTGKNPIREDGTPWSYIKDGGD